jgi:hypothetical protein
MAQDSYTERTEDSYPEQVQVSGWALGLAIFASTIMIMVGIFQAIAGLAALLEDTFYVVGREYAYEVDVTVWGWIHLGLGVLLFFAGWAVLSGQTWARVVGITLAVLSAVANFLFIPYYPIWSLVIIALNVAVIWGLSVYGRREADEIGLSR